MEESTRVNNTRTLKQVVEDVLKEIVKDISRTDLNEIIKTAVWKPDKDNKSVQRFISRMRDRHTREEADAKRLIKRAKHSSLIFIKFQNQVSALNMLWLRIIHRKEWGTKWSTQK
jgi:hypothetical protein